VNENVISELVVGAAGLTLSEPGRGAVGVDAVVELVAERPVDVEPPDPAPDPPHPARATAASATTAPAAGTYLRTGRVICTIAPRE